MAIDEPPREVLESAALLTESSAIEQLRPRVQASVLGDVIGGELLRGGQGLVDQPTAERLDEAARDGSSALVEGDVERVASTVRVFDDYLQGQASSRLQGFMRMVWWASGGSSDAFPGEPGVRLTDREVIQLLRFIFALPAIEDDLYWGVVGEMVDLRRLTALRSQPPAPNLDRFVALNARRLLARYLGLESRTARLPVLGGDVHWRIANGMLTLEADNFNLQITNDLRKFKGLARDKVLPRWSELSERLMPHRLQSVALDAPDQQVMVMSKTSDSSLTDSEAFRNVVRSTGVAPFVQDLTYLSPTGVELRCEFDRRVVIGSRDMPIADLVIQGAEVLVSLGAEGRAALAAAVGQR